MQLCPGAGESLNTQCTWLPYSYFPAWTFLADCAHLSRIVRNYSTLIILQASCISPLNRFPMLNPVSAESLVVPIIRRKQRSQEQKHQLTFHLQAPYEIQLKDKDAGISIWRECIQIPRSIDRNHALRHEPRWGQYWKSWDQRRRGNRAYPWILWTIFRSVRCIKMHEGTHSARRDQVTNIVFIRQIVLRKESETRS